jgi:hypothetical protein
MSGKKGGEARSVLRNLFVGLAAIVFYAGTPRAAPDVSWAGEAKDAAAELRQLAASGQATPLGGSFDHFDLAGQAIPAPSNRNGDVAFFASLLRAKSEEGLFIRTGDEIAKLAAIGDLVPGGERIADFTDRPALALNGAGTVAFVAELAGGVATGGVFIAAHRRIEPVALSGAAAPGIPGGTLTSFDAPMLDDACNVGFRASVRRGRSSGDAIFVYRDGELRKLVAAGDEAPGGGIFSGFGAPAMNNRELVAFPAIVEQGPILGGIFVVGKGQARRMLAAGSPAPGGGIFAKFSEQLAINDAGAIAFSAVLRQGGPESAIFVLEGEMARVIAETGSPAPEGGTFASFPGWPVLSQRGTVGFVAPIDDGPSPLAAYAAERGELRRLVGIGDVLPDGSRLASFARYPAIAIGPEDAITFAAASERDGTRKDALFYLGPPRRGQP